MIPGWIKSIVLLLSKYTKKFRITVFGWLILVHGKGALYLIVSQFPNQNVRCRVRVIEYGNLAFVSFSTWENQLLNENVSYDKNSMMTDTPQKMSNLIWLIFSPNNLPDSL